MTRIPPLTPETATPEQRAAYDALVKTHAVTNMKAALLHAPVALDAVLKWYDLFAQVKPYLGQRLAILFCDAISRENACELCATFMNREIITWGEDPAHLTLDEREQAVVEFGRQLAADANRVSDALYERLARHFTPAQIVELTVFGGLMIVNNLFNSALRIPVDESLAPFRIDPETYFAS
jgi:alkylhydroperoxidase family enzyme